MTSVVRDLYHVALMSAFSPQKPMSVPASSSCVRSGLRLDAGLVVVKNNPPRPLCVGVRPVPCAMPPTRPWPLNVTDVRYGCGSLPASPYEMRALPYVRPLILWKFVYVHAALAFGNTLRLFWRPNVVEPSSRSAPVRYSCWWMSNVALPYVRPLILWKFVYVHAA